MVLSLFVVMLSVIFPAIVEYYDEMCSISYGYPIRDITQDMSRLNPPDFPIYSVISLPYEYPLTEICAG